MRPGYPPALVDAVVGSVPGARHVVEIGCGTGKATSLLAERGLAVTGVEPDAEMAAVARRKLARYSEVSVVVARFEDWEGAPASCDIVAAAQAWHWVDAGVALAKAARILRRPGALALFANTPRPDDTELRPALDGVYRRHAPGIAETSVMTRWCDGPAQLEDWRGRIAAGGFRTPQVHAYDWDCVYTTEEFLTLLQTHSDHRRLPVEDRRTLLDGIAGVIEANGGSFTFAYRAILLVCPARPEAAR